MSYRRFLPFPFAFGASSVVLACWPILGGDLPRETFADDASTDDGSSALADASVPDFSPVDAAEGPVDTLWRADVPICWMPADPEAPADGWKREKAAIRRSVIEAWQRTTSVHFAGWNDCPTSGTERFVKIHIGARAASAQASAQVDALGPALLRSPLDPSCNPDETGADAGQRHCSSVRFWFHADHSTIETGVHSIKYWAVHAFGHVLGFGDTVTSTPCASVDVKGGLSIAPYDERHSVMNNCGALVGDLAADDISGAEAVYRPPTYPTLTKNARYFHDVNGSLVREDAAGSDTNIPAGAGGGAPLIASSSLASFAFPLAGPTAWFLDTRKSSHLMELAFPPAGAMAVRDWGAGPSGCTWTGSPAVASWGEGRADVFVDATCAGQTHLFHAAWEGRDFPWVDITPPGIDIGSSPAAVAREIGVVDVIVLSGSSIVHASCTGNCTGADGAAFVWNQPSLPMRQGDEKSPWLKEPALTSPTPGTLRAFGIDANGRIDISDWSWSAPDVWTGSTIWYSPQPACATSPASPAVVRTQLGELFVGCTDEAGNFTSGWGKTTREGQWYTTALHVSGGVGLCAN